MPSGEMAGVGLLPGWLVSRCAMPPSSADRPEVALSGEDERVAVDRRGTDRAFAVRLGQGGCRGQRREGEREQAVSIVGVLLRAEGAILTAGSPRGVAMIRPEKGPRVAELVPAPFPHLLRRMLRELERARGSSTSPRAVRARRCPPRPLGALPRAAGRHALRPRRRAPTRSSPRTSSSPGSRAAASSSSRPSRSTTGCTIPRPCIDMRTVGYNVEWSQELRLEESLEEYVKGAMLIGISRRAALGRHRARMRRHRSSTSERGLRPGGHPRDRGAALPRAG